MTKIKLCGITRLCDIETVNALKPEYVGFVFATQSKRCVTPAQAALLRRALHPDIQAVGVFVDEPVEQVAALLKEKVIDMAQLHGSESEDDIRRLQKLSGRPVIRAFRVKSAEDLADVQDCCADYVLLDSGAGSGRTFDWTLLKQMKRSYFLAGGMDALNVGDAVRQLHPYAVDVSSGIETDGLKDKEKMTAFVEAVRREERL